MSYLRSAVTSHNPDHTNPICQYSLGAQLLYEHLPGSKLTSKQGLSNLLSWLGTGQGFVTQSFLKFVARNGGFYADNVETMIDRFHNAVSTNWHLINQRSSSNTRKSKSRTPKLPDLIVTYDAHIWGQASNHLALLPTYTSGDRRGSKYTIDEKFNQYFTPVVQHKWTIALKDMLGQDPQKYVGELRSWAYYHQMVKNLNIPGFQQGLTVFQLANYLVFLGIAKMPHWSEVADFIAENRQKGAFRGLEKLGFNMPDSSSVRAAFYCVHHYLEKTLSDDDKHILGFSPLFTEHLLCKVIRWAKHLSTEGGIDFYRMGQDAESSQTTWVVGSNATDEHAFPFLLTIDKESIRAAIKEAGVRIPNVFTFRILMILHRNFMHEYCLMG